MKRSNASLGEPRDLTSGASSEEDPSLVEHARKQLRTALEAQGPATPQAAQTSGFFQGLGTQMDDLDDEGEVDDSDEEDSDEEEPSPTLGMVDVSEGRVGVVCDAPIMTNGMGPCIAIGKTGLFREHRFSALIHWDGIGPSSNVAALFGRLNAAIERKMLKVLVEDGPLTDVKYLVVGGRPSAAANQQAIRDELGSLDGPVTEFLVTPENTEFAAEAESSATISATGEFTYQVVREGQ